MWRQQRTTGYIAGLFLGLGSLLLVMVNSWRPPVSATTSARDKLEEARGYLAETPPNCFKAVQPLSDLLSVAPDNYEANLYAGACYYAIGAHQQAEQYLHQAISLHPDDVEPEAYLLLGEIYKLKGECDKASELFKTYLRRLSDKEEKSRKVDRVFAYAILQKPITTPADKITIKGLGQRVKHSMRECYHLQTLLQDTTDDVELVNLGPNVNSPYPDYGPVITADDEELYFTSRRMDATGAEEGVLAPDGFPYEDIYVARRNRKTGKWEKATNLGEPVNTSTHESIVSISVDKKMMIIYKDVRNGDLYISYFRDGMWQEPEPLPKPINSKYSEKSAVFSPDGKTIYFTSNRKGGPGGLDIWVSHWDDNKNRWSKPVPLSDSVNTPYDEDGLFLHPDGKTLYFSSKGHNSIGGYDVFKTTRRGNVWTKAKNLGYPLNSPGDDIYFVVASDGETGYFSSERYGTLGEKDIFMVKLTDAQRPEQFFVLIKGKVYDQFTEEPIYSDIIVIDKETGDTVWNNFSDSKTGEFVASLPVGKHYLVKIIAEDYQSFEDELFIPDTVRYTEKEYNIMLKPNKIMLLGEVVDASTGEPLDAWVTVTDNETGDIVVEKPTDSAGTFKITLKLGRNYGIRIEKEGYLWHSENLQVPDTLDEFYKEYHVELQPIAVGAKVALRNIFFEFGSAELRPESYPELDKAVEFLKKYPYIKVELAGHTDSVGSESYNLRLSQRRAEAVRRYLISKGISPDRLIAKGYGESQPIAPNTNPDGTDNPEGRALNRRVEFRIISVGE